MLSPARALSLNAEAGRELPRVPALKALYARGCRPRHGEVIMVAGRSGTQKSGFALWWTCQMNLPTLYLSADMSPFTASARVASLMMNLTTDEVEAQMQRGGRERDAVLESMEDLNLTFSFGAITWPGVDAEIEAWVELHNAYPEMIVIDNLCDLEGAASDYAIQMDAMQNITDPVSYT